MKQLKFVLILILVLGMGQAWAACGDGTVDTGEACDDGNIITETDADCEYRAICPICNADCSAVLSLNGGICGDEVVDEGYEECDDGNDIVGDGCDTACLNEVDFSIKVHAYDYARNIVQKIKNIGFSAVEITATNVNMDKEFVLTIGESIKYNNKVITLEDIASCSNGICSIAVSVDGIHETISGTETVNEIEITVSATSETSASLIINKNLLPNTWLFSSKNAVPAGIVGHNIYCDMQGALCCIMTDGDYCKDYYVTEVGGFYDGSDCVCNDTEDFDEEMPWRSVYPYQFTQVGISEEKEDEYTNIIEDDEPYQFSDCEVSGDKSTCYIKAYFNDFRGDILEDLDTLEIERDTASIPRINYTVAGEPETNKDIYYINVEAYEPADPEAEPEAYKVVFDASQSQFKSSTCYGGEECYFVDSSGNNLEYNWYIEIHNDPWGNVDNFLCTDGVDSCVNPICESQCQDESPCTCLQFDTDGKIYDGYTDNRQTFTYPFASSDVCGPDKSCAITLTITDKTTLSSDTKQFGIVLSDLATLGSPYGEFSQKCELGGERIAHTGYCCKDGYMINPEYNNFNELFANRMDACVDKPNKNPIARISFPEDDETYESGSGEDIYFRAEGTDSDGNITGYLWDFGDRTEPWGYLETNKYDEIICKAATGSKSCDEEEAVSLDDYDKDEEVPCSCKLEYGEDLLNIYPESVSTKQKTIHKYEDKYACSEYDEEKESECEITLWVFDNEDGSGKTRITIDLSEEGSDDGIDGDYGIDFYCGDGLVTGSEECDVGEITECDSGNCASDCTCVDEDSVGDDIGLIDNNNNVDNSDAVCGNNICEFGENSATCLTDCHCGDGVCQESMESNNTCPSDCKSGSSTFILLVIILAAVGIVFVLYKQGFDFSRITDILHMLKIPKFGKGSKETNMDTTMPEMPSIKTPESSLEEYIRSTRRKGFSYSQIKDTLEKKGWKEDKINEIFRNVGLP
jgi:cysteine-rich repeat protein